MNSSKLNFLKKIEKEIFNKYKIKVFPIKLYHDDLDIDLVVLNSKDFKLARKCLIKEGFKLKKTISILREPYKRLYEKQGDKFKIHLHKYISWNGSIYLDAKKVWERSEIINGIRELSNEDELLIMAAHNIFENIYFPNEDKPLYEELSKKKLDQEYIKKIVKKYNWKSGFEIFIKFANKEIKLFPFFPVFIVYMRKLILDIFKLRVRYIPREFFTFFIVNYFWCYRNAKKRSKRC